MKKMCTYFDNSRYKRSKEKFLYKLGLKKEKQGLFRSRFLIFIEITKYEKRRGIIKKI
jgi:hypothetical protein